MLENLIESFSENLFVFLTGRTTGGKGLLIKKHAENLQTHGDFSFPSSSKSWMEHIEKPTTNEDATLLQVIGKTHEDIVDESRKFKLQVEKVKEEKGRIYLFLDRPGAVSLSLAAGLQNAVLVSEKLKGRCDIVKKDPLCETSNCLTYLRVKYVGKVIENLCLILTSEHKLPEIFVTSKSYGTCTGFKILCSTVLSAKTSKKENDISSDEFIR